MCRTSKALVLVTLVGCAGAGCTTFRRQPADPIPTRTLSADLGSFRMSVAVDRDRSIDLAEHAPLVGRIDVGPILDAEGRNVNAVQVLLHEGCYYITAEGFRNLWEVTPRRGTTLATFRSIAVSDQPLAEVRMSRYGPANSPCLRLDADGGGPWYLTHGGELLDRCR